jgi:hypothetical protein
MIGPRDLQAADTGATDIASEIKTALDHLAKAYNYASDVRSDAWEFAVELGQLMALGLTTTDLRWLVKKGYIEHAPEITQTGDAERGFLPIQHHTAFAKETCFTLTDTGLLIARGKHDHREVLHFAKGGANRPGGDLVPRWDSASRALYLGDRIVKQYLVPSPNQQSVLEAFQEEQWPPYIDDPIPPAPEQDQKIRLRDTIKCLNAHQKIQLIRFHGDGTGEGIRWELTEDATSQFSAPKLRLFRAA